MITKHKKTRPAEQYEVEEATCDLCGKKADRVEWNGVEWSRGAYDVSKTGVYLEEGDNYPEGRDTTTTEFHICPKCFKAKLVPWLESQGAEPSHEEHRC
jgi:hypothetical protein